MTVKKILFIGDINIDIIMAGLVSQPVVDREITCKSFEITMGSSAVLSACAYSCLGGESSFAGLAGRDDYGDFMIRRMKDFKINTTLIERTGRFKTGVTVNLVHGRYRTQVTYPGTIAEFDGKMLDKNCLDRFDHIHLAGVYQQDKFRPKIGKLLRLARERNVSTSLDPQWDASQKWEEMDGWLPYLSMIFLNEQEALSLTGEPTPERACAALRKRTDLPVVKAGNRGAYICVEHNRVEAVPPPDVEVIDTTGAGDSFDSGFLFARLCAGMNLIDACRLANAAGSRCCTFIGGMTARSGFEDVSNLMREWYEAD